MPRIFGDSQPRVTTTVLDNVLVTCPMCHAPTSLTPDAIDAGADWRCVRCGQLWDATRLSAVAAYAAWAVERAAGERASLPPMEADIPTIPESESRSAFEGPLFVTVSV